MVLPLIAIQEMRVRFPPVARPVSHTRRSKAFDENYVEDVTGSVTSMGFIYYCFLAGILYCVCMEKDYTHITMLIDRSGSMMRVWGDVQGGYKSLVDLNKKEKGKCTFSLSVFDHEYTKVEDFTKIKKVSGSLGVSPRGSTAYYDAMHKAIIETHEAIKGLSKSERPEKVLFMVQTDGLENSSREVSGKDVKELVAKFRDKYGWDFMFLGAGEEALKNAANVGISPNATLNHSVKNTGMMIQNLGAKTLAYRAAKTADQLESARSFSAKEREEAVK